MFSAFALDTTIVKRESQITQSFLRLVLNQKNPHIHSKTYFITHFNTIAKAALAQKD